MLIMKVPGESGFKLMFHITRGI